MATNATSSYQTNGVEASLYDDVYSSRWAGLLILGVMMVMLFAIVVSVLFGCMRRALRPRPRDLPHADVELTTPVIHGVGVVEGETALTIHGVALIRGESAFIVFESGEECPIRYSVGCHICYAQFTGGDQLCMLPCEHAYHADCVSSWLDRRYTCPDCRADVSIIVDVV